MLFEDREATITLTYAELDRQSNIMARYLVGTGLGPDQIVALLLDRSAEMLIALLAVQKAGAAYLPLDPDYPTGRLEYMLADSQAKVLITSRTRYLALQAEVSITLAPGILIDDPATKATLRGLDASPLSRAEQGMHVAPENLAYVIYTSGSTGKPKGVGISNAGLGLFLSAVGKVVPLTSSDRLLAITTIGFDIAALELYLPLIHGARIVLLDGAASRDPQAIGQAIDRHQISVIQATPSLWEMILGEPITRPLRLLSGGEALPNYLARQMSIVGPVTNLYGPTEATVWASTQAVGQEDASSSLAAAAIGKPLEGYDIYIVDARLEPVPDGVVGEIYIAGHALARGYLYRPGLTAERFIACPFGKPGERMYRSGDLARRRADGAIEYLTRADDQVKIRGHRIELGEIDAVILGCDGVRQSVTLTRRSMAGDIRLASYIVIEESAPVIAVMNQQAEHRLQDQWQQLYDDSYQQAVAAEADFDTSIWISTYTRNAIPAAQMTEWLQTTIARINTIAARNVWEIGSGSGLILWNIIDKVDQYYGTDLSEQSIRKLEPLVLERGLHNVRLEHRTASDIPDIVDQTFDLVILNSVVQYFPSARYLKHVIDAAMRASSHALFVGDVRSLAHHHAFWTSVELFQADDPEPVSDIARRIRDRLRADRELLVDPAFFTEFASQPHVHAVIESQIKRGAHLNEMSRWRYDVTLIRCEDLTVLKPVQKQSWQSITQLRHALSAGIGASLEVLNIPNARIASDVWAAARIDSFAGSARELKALAERAAQHAIDPDLLYMLADSLGLRLRLIWSQTELACVHALFEQPGQPLRNWFPEGARSPHALTSDPLREQMQDHLIDGIRVVIGKSLPEYMVPEVMTTLDRLPLTPSGKLDRRALAASGQRVSHKAYRGPKTEQQALLCRLFSEITGTDPVGLDDNFFAIGGHSLLAMRLIARLRQEGVVSLAMRTLFEFPTPEQLAPHLETHTVSVYTPLLPLRKSGTQPTLFCIHPAGGSGTVYKNLTDALGPDHPVWALQARGLEDGESVHETMQELVYDYAAAIRSHQPQGPYHLLGTSLGGLIAHAIACHLESQGHEVALLALLDTATIFSGPGGDTPEARKRTLLLAIANDSGLAGVGDLSIENDLLMTGVRDHMAEVGMIPADTPLDWFRRLLHLSVSSGNLTAGHVIHQATAPILLFRALLEQAPELGTAFDWQPYTSGDVTVVGVQAKHSEMLWQPGAVPVIASVIRDYLNKISTCVAR